MVFQTMPKSNASILSGHNLTGAARIEVRRNPKENIIKPIKDIMIAKIDLRSIRDSVRSEAQREIEKEKPRERIIVSFFAYLYLFGLLRFVVI